MAIDGHRFKSIVWWTVSIGGCISKSIVTGDVMSSIIGL